MSNPVIHFEIIGKQPKALQQFYRDLFQWQINAENPTQYGIVAKEANGIGGGIAGPDLAQQHQVTVYVEVEDVQIALDRAVELGGKVILPVTAIPGMATIAQFADIEDNVIGLVLKQG